MVSCKWMCRLKEEQKENGTLCIRYKSGLLALEFSQVEGIDNFETFDIVIKLPST